MLELTPIFFSLAPFIVVAAVSGFVLGSRPSYWGSTGGKRFLYWCFGLCTYSAFATVCEIIYVLVRFGPICRSMDSSNYTCTIGPSLAQAFPESFSHVAIANLIGLPLYCLFLEETERRLRLAGEAPKS